MKRVLRASLALLTCASIIAFTTRLEAQTQSVTLAWDQSPDPTVIGYIVYVGTEPGSPLESYRVDGTSFVYENALIDRPYFFSVAAYSAGLSVGSPSDEVLFLGGRPVVTRLPGDSSTLASAYQRDPAAGSATAPAQPGEPSTQTVCLGVHATDCYSAVSTVGDFGRIDALEALGDSRLILIETALAS